MTEAENDIQPQLERWRDDARRSAEAFAELRRRTEESSRRLESPPGVLQFIDFFSVFFADAAEVFDRVKTEAAQAPLGVHAEALRQVASNASVEQRRCLQFRDKWINRPLPYEDVRPLLTEIVNAAAHRLPDYRALNALADQVGAIAAPAPPTADEGRPLDRRQLFTKWFGR
jgi:hypothetical protein